MSESEYQSIPAIAIFDNNSVILKVPGIGDNFVGQQDAIVVGGEISSKGDLYYRCMPEGNFTMTFRSTPNELEIDFKEEGEDLGLKFVGKPIASFTPPMGSSGSGTWNFINIYQQVSLLALLSNIIRNEKNSVNALQLSAQKKIFWGAKLLGWTITWGPVVWKNDPDNKLTGPDHVWFVAKKSYKGKPDTYVIAVAGSATMYNHIIHNAGVVQVVDFTKWATNTPPSPTSAIDHSGTYVAFGTAQGVHTLRSYPSPVPANAGKTLSNFLKDLPHVPGTKFIFTGFSLGGALSPTLALALKKDPAVFKGGDEVLTYPIAGASPGNKGFAKLFADQFPKIPTGSAYKVWNTNIANSLDIVPHGWSTDSGQSQNLGKIPKLYGNNPALPGVERKINLAMDAASKSGLVYIPLQNTVFSPAPVKPPKNVEKFIEIATRQHSIAYLVYLAIGGIFKVLTGLKGSIVEDEPAAVKLEDAGEEDEVEFDQEEMDLFPGLVLDI